MLTNWFTFLLYKFLKVKLSVRHTDTCNFWSNTNTTAAWEWEKNASLTYRHTLTGAALDKAEAAGYLSLTSAFHVVNSPFSCWRSLQSEPLFRRSWSCCYDCCSLHSPVLCLCPSLDSFTAREVCVFVSLFRALGLSKTGNQILHKCILSFLCPSFLFPLFDFLSLWYGIRENYWSINCAKFFFSREKKRSCWQLL